MVAVKPINWILDMKAMDMALIVRMAMDLIERHNFMACGQAHGPDLGFQRVGHDVDPMDAMNPKDGNIFTACSQTQRMDFEFQGVGQGVDPMKAMDPKKRNNVLTCGQAYGPDFGFQGGRHGVDSHYEEDLEQENCFDVRVVDGCPPC